MEKQKENKIVNVIDLKLKEQIEKELEGLKFTKNFRSATAEEWYVFLPGFQDPQTGGPRVRLSFIIIYMATEMFLLILLLFLMHLSCMPQNCTL